jgi:hypothetical protein
MEKKRYISREKILEWYEKNRLEEYLLYRLNPEKHMINLKADIIMDITLNGIVEGVTLEIDNNMVRDSAVSEIVDGKVEFETMIININSPDANRFKMKVKILDDSWIVEK